MELLLKTRDLWASPAQFAVMTVLCWKDHDKRGFAAPSKVEIARLVGLSPGHVKKIYWQLEAMHALERIGTDREFGGKQRFVVSIEKAIEERASLSLPGIAGDPGGGSQAIPGGDRGYTPGGSQAIPPSPTNVQTYKTVQNANEATAAPRLPLFPLEARPAHPEHRAIAAARQVRVERLRRRVAGLARSILFTPTLGRELLGGDVATSIDALVEATKRLCARKRVAGYGEVVHAMCTSELFKFRHPAVMRGEAPRPRDRRRAQ
jgi:hypothetical protein